MTHPSNTPHRIDVAEATALIADTMPAFPQQRVPLAEAAGQVLAESIVAERDQPPFDRATMDGIALHGADLTDSRTFRLAGTQAAGAAQQALPDTGACLEIMTGAVLPAGADTVIPVERIRIVDDAVHVEDGYPAARGQFVHRQASDHARGAALLEPGTLIRGPEMAILTAAGKADVAITPWPRIAIVSTGDELVDVGVEILDHQIRSSNDRAIETALRLRGCAATSRTHLPDDPEAMFKAVHDLHESHDVLVLSGGVSMGKYDYVPGILRELGVHVVFHKIRQRPGLPMWYGISSAGKPVFALPGNPVSTLVCLIRYVAPALQASLGFAPAAEIVQLAEAVDFEPDLCWFLPVALHNDGGALVATPRPTNTSGDFVGLRQTDGCVELPRGAARFPRGYRARLWRW